MAVSNGQPVNASVTNAAYISKTNTGTETTVAVIDLNNAGSGAQVSNTQQAINDNITDISTNTSDIATNTSGIASNLSSITTLQGTAPTADEKAALAGTDGSPSVSNKYVTDSDPRLSGGEQSETISNAQTNTDFLNMVFDEANGHTVILDYAMRRRTDSDEKQATGEIVLQYKIDAAVWEVSEDHYSNEDMGTTFDVGTAAGVGTVDYTTDTLAGANYNGELFFSVRKTFSQFSS